MFDNDETDSKMIASRRSLIKNKLDFIWADIHVLSVETISISNCS